MPGARSIAISVRATILAWSHFLKKCKRGPLGPPYFFFLLFIMGKKLINQNDIEFNFSIGHACVLFPFLRIIDKKMKDEQCNPPTNPQKLIYIDIYIVPNILFSPNLMTIITRTFRNTSNPLKLYEITLFHTGSLAYGSVYESSESSLWWWHELQIRATGSIFIVETWNLQTSFPIS